MNAVERIVVEELGWIWREQMIMDMGIDAHIELARVRSEGAYCATALAGHNRVPTWPFLTT